MKTGIRTFLAAMLCVCLMLEIPLWAYADTFFMPDFMAEAKTDDETTGNLSGRNQFYGKLLIGNYLSGEAIFEASTAMQEREEQNRTVKSSASRMHAVRELLSDASGQDNSVSGNTVSGNSVSGNTVSGNSVSGNTVSGNSVSGNTVSGNSVSGNTVSGNTVSGNSVSDNTVSGNAVSGNTVSQNTEPENDMPQPGTSVSDPVKPEEITPQKEQLPAAPPVQAITVGTPVLKKAVNSRMGKVKITFTGASNAVGYEVQYSRKKSFKSYVTVDTVSKSATIANLPKGKNYTFRVRGYYRNADGTLTYGTYSNKLTVKIKKGLEEVPYAQASSKVKSCKMANRTTFKFSASIKKLVASSDDLYYLCQMDPYTNKKVRIVASMAKDTSVVFKLPVFANDGTNLIEGRYAICIKKDNVFKPVTPSQYISNPSAAAAYTAAFPKAASKKGIQGADGQSDLGVSHSLINIPLTDVYGTKADGVPYLYNGKVYYFKGNPYVGTIRRCNRDNITISAVFLLPWDEGLKSLIIKKGRKPMAAHYFALNIQQKAAREKLEAAFMYLAELYSRENCHLDNWILGNEVNVPNPWNFAGNTAYENYVRDYAQAFRTMYYAAVSHNKNARAYISLDNNWMGGSGVYSAREFMVHFNKEVKVLDSKISWNLAYHAYPAPLTAAAFWNNPQAIQNENSQYVTPKNITVLTKFVKKKFGKKTRIILSEQGFTSTAGEHTQAAAIAYAYYIAEFNDMIDSIIIRSDIDNEVESAQGLKMGLRNLDGSRKAAYNVFKYMDTPQYQTYTANCLATLGKKNWSSLVKGFKDSKLKKMPLRI
ncbi:MAG: hypothetical protein E7294_13340 [Lachnospiraceae bacterium]|nr:hypothetical protein [Lachnospiraceae bacterium]